METTVDRFGRVVIPKPIRDGLGLRPGTTLTVEEEEDAVVLRAVHGEPNLVVHDGVLVYTGSAGGDVEGMTGVLRRGRLLRESARNRP